LGRLGHGRPPPNEKKRTTETQRTQREETQREELGRRNHSMSIIDNTRFLLSLCFFSLCPLCLCGSFTPAHHAKWENALLASAILMVFSRLVMASPSRR